MRKLPIWADLLFVGALCATIVACGGEIVGIGNTGNRIGAGTIDEFAIALAQNPATPEVTDAMLSKIFSAMVERASEGDPEAALIVLMVGQEQRRAAEE